MANSKRGMVDLIALGPENISQEWIQDCKMEGGWPLKCMDLHI